MTHWKETNDPPWESQGVPRPHCSHSVKTWKALTGFPFSFFFLFLGFSLSEKEEKQKENFVKRGTGMSTFWRQICNINKRIKRRRGMQKVGTEERP